MARIIAHRGFAGAAPENTVAATCFAAKHGADLVEIDAMPTADGRVVAFHDDRLDNQGDSRGITDKTGIVWETPYDEIREATVLGTGERIPLLSEICRAVPEGTGLNVELKQCGIDDIVRGTIPDESIRDERVALWKPFVRDVLAILDEFDHEVLFSSFAEGALAALKEEAPDATLAPLVVDQLDVGIELARRYEAAAIHPSFNAFGPSENTRSTGESTRIACLQREGYDVNVWTIESWYRMRRLDSIGVDGLIVDYPGLDGWKYDG